MVHYANGHIGKGFSGDLFPNKPIFHLQEDDSDRPTEVGLEELKAVYYVKDFAGDSGYQTRDDVERPGLGRKIRVRFRDGETVIGYTNGYSADRLAFFLFPADGEENNQRILVVTKATEEVSLL